MPKPDLCIAITSGEPAGIGPEIIAGIDAGQFSARLVIIGDRELIESRGRTVNPSLKYTDYQLQKVHSPIPSHKLSDALKIKKSGVGYFTLAGGIIGFFTIVF